MLLFVYFGYIDIMAGMWYSLAYKRKHFSRGEKVVINVENEINKYKGKSREELERVIQEYKNLAIQHAKDFTVAGQYNMVAQKLRGICDRLPAPNLVHHAVSAPRTPVKTVSLTNDDEAEIKAAWEKRAGNKGIKR